ncbi:hypothetical protein LTR08_006482 [Meristemomyces frigidus]|nr:hypothetical protein LTR08_006482 [Meristemomyces frigidus]
MPQPRPPPTPGSSSDLRGKEGSIGSASALKLPPTAFHEQVRLSNASSTSSASGSDSSYRPASPPSPVELSRKRSAIQAGLVAPKADFALPPPPTRSRKIIQMTPRESGQPSTAQAQSAAMPLSATGRFDSTSAQSGSGKRKQSGTGNTAASRKVARKTAHSVIERRRRSKMNEEFGVLQDMIPACQGQEMHKLAILQASIEYLRYLEQCVKDLQAQGHSPRLSPPPVVAVAQGAQDHNNDDDDDLDDDEEEHENENVNMREAHHAQPIAPTTAKGVPEHRASLVSLPSLSELTKTLAASPSIFPTTSVDGRHYSISSAASQTSYSPYFHSAHTSPAFGPQLSHMHSAPPLFNPAFGLGSPALGPVDSGTHAYTLRQIAQESASESMRGGEGARTSEDELDREAAAALNMLNHDRRGWRPSIANAGLAEGGAEGRVKRGRVSVGDLLSG